MSIGTFHFIDFFSSHVGIYPTPSGHPASSFWSSKEHGTPFRPVTVQSLPKSLSPFAPAHFAGRMRVGQKFSEMVRSDSVSLLL